MKRSVQFSLVLAASAVAVSGCRVFHASCDAPPEGKEIATIPSIRVPEGVPAPDTTAALRIPELKQPERVRRSSEPCLEDPPLYTPGWKPEEKRQDPNAPAPAEGTPEPKKKHWWWPFGRG